MNTLDIRMPESKRVETNTATASEESDKSDKNSNLDTKSARDKLI